MNKLSKIIKIILSALSIIIIVLIIPGAAYAEEYSFESDDEADIYGELYSGIVPEDFADSIPENAKQFIYDYNISPENPLSFESITSADGLKSIFEALKDYLLSPIKTAAILLTAILLCSLVSGINSDEQSAVSTTIKSFSSLVCASLIITPVTLLIADCTELLCSLSVFMTALIPVYAGLLIATAKVGTALGFQTPVFIATQAISYIGTYIVTPFCSMFLALSVSGGISGEKRLFGFAETLKKTAMWVMSVAMTVYMAVFSIKNVISGTTDSAGSKTARFLISSFVPIVGVSINEALSSMKGCIDILSRSVSIYAVIIMLSIIVPVLIRLIFWRIMLGLCSGAAEMFCNETISTLLKSVSSAIMILTSVVICTSVMYIFSVTVLSNAAASI